MCRLDLCQVSVCAELRLTGQMKVVLPHSCLLGILHHQHHFLCVRCQDDLKGRVVIWSVIFKKLCTLKRNGNAQFKTALWTKCLLTLSD